MGVTVELVDLRSEQHPERVLLCVGDTDAGVSLIDELSAALSGWLAAIRHQIVVYRP